MNGLDINDIIRALGPRSGIDLLYDIMLYLMFFLDLILMFMQGDKELITTVFAGSAAALAVVAKLNIFPPKNFGSLVLNAGLLILPLLVTGISKQDKSRPVGVIVSIISGLHFFLFWFMEQR